MHFIYFFIGRGRDREFRGRAFLHSLDREPYNIIIGGHSTNPSISAGPKREKILLSNS